MSRARELLPVVALPLAVVVIAVVASQFLTAGTTSPLAGTPAPRVALPVVAGPGSDEGDRIDTDRLRGGVVILDFWASWCPPCRQSIPILNRIQARNRERGVTVVGINLERQMDRPTLLAAHRAFGAGFPSLQDRTGDVQDAYGVAELPTLVLIDPDGTIQYAASGVPDEEDLQARIDSILN